MGIGDWGLGIGDWGLGPIPNPQSPMTLYQLITLLVSKNYNLYIFFNLKLQKNKVDYLIIYLICSLLAQLDDTLFNISSLYLINPFLTSLNSSAIFNNISFNEIKALS